MADVDQMVGADTRREAGLWRLPDLSARGALIYRLCWALLAVVAIGANLSAPYFNTHMRETIHEPFSHLGLRQWDGRRLQVPHRPSLERAGVTAGSEIVAVGGQPVPPEATMEEVARALSAQPSPALVTIKSPDGTVRNFSLPRDPRWMELSYAGTGLTFHSRIVIDLVFAGFANLALFAASTLLFWRRPRSGLAALLSLSLLGFAAFENLTWYTWQQLGLFDYVEYLFSASFTALLIGLLLCPDGRFQPSWSRGVALALIVSAGLSFVVEALGFPEWLSIGVFLSTAVLVVPAMRSRFRSTPIGSEAWQQQRWLLLGMSLGAAAMIATFILSTVANSGQLNRQQLVWAYISSGVTLSLVPLFVALGILVALLRYRLYDSDAALSRSAGFAIVGLTFAALFAGFAKAIEIGIEQLSGASAGATPGIAAAVLATVVVTPAQSRIQSWTDERFRKALAHLRRDLPACVDDLREVASLEELIAEVLERIISGLRITRAAIEIDGRLVSRTEGVADVQEPWSMRLPLRVHHRGGSEDGWLLLGKRPDGSLPARDEREALEEILDPIARALWIVRSREARDRAQAERWEQLDSRIAKLEQARAS